MLVVDSIPSQVENPPLTVGFSCIVSGQNNGDVHEIIFWRRRNMKSN